MSRAFEEIREFVLDKIGAEKHRSSIATCILEWASRAVAADAKRDARRYSTEEESKPKRESVDKWGLLPLRDRKYSKSDKIVVLAAAHDCISPINKFYPWTRQETRSDEEVKFLELTVTMAELLPLEDREYPPVFRKSEEQLQIISSWLPELAADLSSSRRRGRKPVDAELDKFVARISRERSKGVLNEAGKLDHKKIAELASQELDRPVSSVDIKNSMRRLRKG